jgi:ferrous iron transport protein B
MGEDKNSFIDSIVIALAGNPNSGKTCIFNEITGARQHVGNYPGVTVEKKEGILERDGLAIKVVDLPGTYSLTAYSIEERVARQFIIDERPDVVVNILDASNIERNLYLTTQLKELGVPLVLALNMADVAKNRGVQFDLEMLSERLGAPIVPTVGNRGKGIDELLEAVVEVARGEREESLEQIRYGREIEARLELIAEALEKADEQNGLDSRWVAIKLLEGDEEVARNVDSPEVHDLVQKSQEKLEALVGDSPAIVIAERRYGFISGACQEAVRSTVEARHDMSDRIDAVVTNRFLAIPLFLGLMYLVFQLTFTLGEAPMGWIENGFEWLGTTLDSQWPTGSESPLRALLVEGLIGGVGGVIVFLPNILMLFMAIAFLEDTGYMARAAFIMDRLMHKIGLHGKSFIPMLIGFGCTVPAIMATRTLDSRRDRLTTMLVAPLMSCGARLPIYMLIIPAFFPENLQAPMLWTIYVIGIVLAIFCAKLLRGTILAGPTKPFVMELPPYRLPTLRAVLIHMWERAWLYVKKAGTIILTISIILWALTSYPKKKVFDADYEAELLAAQAAYEEEIALSRAEDRVARDEAVVTAEIRLAQRQEEIANRQHSEEIAYSLTGRIGHALEPVLAPMGFDWRIGTALLGAVAAKEVFVAQMGIVYAVGEADQESEPLRDVLRSAYSPLVGFCIMLFCLIAAPCMATLAVTRRESGSWKWALLQFGGLTALAWVLTVLVFQVGTLFGIGV